MTALTIAMVSEHASPLAALGGADAGGQNVHVAELAAALAARGHDVAVYTRRDDPDLPDRVTVTDAGPGRVVVEHLAAGPAAPLPKDALLPYVPQLGEALTARLARSRPDVVHAHFWMSGLAACAARRALGVPVVQTFHALGVVKRRHQGDADTSPDSRLALEPDLARDVDRVLASSRDERTELVALGADPERIDVVPSGVDLARFHPDGPAVERGGRPRLVVVSRLVPRKGVDDAIRVAARLPEVELVVAGGPADGSFDDDDETRRLRALARELGVDDRVTFLGGIGRDDVAPLLRSADLVLCLPWYEPFGIVPLEAMACGVPVVGAGVGGLLDTVVDGLTGVHVPPREPDVAAAAVAALMDDPARRARMGRAGADRAHAYSWDAVAARVERSYEAVLPASGAQDDPGAGPVTNGASGGAARRPVAPAGVAG